ncbi:MAG: TolB-like 6-bladed beta-propeller domain-containing protein [Prevotellaceae bacterium]|jgi:hypothetical protein|nr:TolB-like 6-bladed beta-propeller domain-containing protein [Prevotellaceae bacterium]
MIPCRVIPFNIKLKDMRTKLQIYIVMVLFAACSEPVSKNNVVVITEFPVTKELKASVVHTAPVILAPEAMFILEDQIYIAQSKKDTIFDVFDLNDCRYLHSVGTRGGGPNEFIFPLVRTVQVHDKQFTMLDRAFMRTIEITPNGSLQIVKSEYIFDEIPVNGFLRLNDSLCCAFADCFSGTESNFEYKVKNIYSKTAPAIKFSEYPNLSKRKFTGDKRCEIYNKYSTANSTHGKFAAFYAFFKFFRIYKITNTNIIEIEKEVHVNVPPFEQVEEVDDWQKRKVFHGRVFSTDKYIYVYSIPHGIQVWDWDGNPIISYLFDHKFIAFTISEKNRKIYTVSALEENWDKFFVYDLSHLP